MAGNGGQGYLYPGSQAPWSTPSAPGARVAQLGYSSLSGLPTHLPSGAPYSQVEDPSRHTLVYTIERRGNTPRETNQLHGPPFSTPQIRSSRLPDASYAQRLYASSIPKQKRATNPPPRGSDELAPPPPPPVNVHRARHTSIPDHQVETLSRAFSSESFHVSSPPPAPPVVDQTGQRYPITPPSNYRDEKSKSSKMASFGHGASSSSQDYAFHIPEDDVPAYEMPTFKTKSSKIPEEPVQVTVVSDPPPPPPPPVECVIEQPQPAPPPPADPMEQYLSGEEETTEEAPPYTLVDETPPPPSIEDTPTDTEPREPTVHPISAADDSLPRTPAYTAVEPPPSRSPIPQPSSRPIAPEPREPSFHSLTAADDTLSRAPVYIAVEPPRVQSPLSPVDNTARRMHGPRRLSNVSTFSTASSIVSGLAVDLYGSAYKSFRPQQREHTLPPQNTHPGNPMFVPPPPSMFPQVPGHETAGRESGTELPDAPQVFVPPQHAPHHTMPSHFPQPHQQFLSDGRPLNHPNIPPPINFHHHPPPPSEWQRGPQTCPTIYTSLPPPHSPLDASSPSLALTVPQHHSYPAPQQQPSQKLRKRPAGPNRPSTAPSTSSLTPAERWAQQPPMPRPW
ncbi:hypothetical protein V8B97DRAFT_1290472 [Scleroderma yunnanense]